MKCLFICSCKKNFLYKSPALKKFQRVSRRRISAVFLLPDNSFVRKDSFSHGEVLHRWTKIKDYAFQA